MSTFAHALTHRLNLCDVTVKTASGNVTMLNEGAVVVNKASGAATTVTLPVAAGLIAGIDPVVWVIDGKGDAATNNITVNTSDSKTVNGASSYTVSENYGVAAFFWNGTEWNVVGGFNFRSSTEFGFLDGVTAGTAAASKAVVLDSSSNVAGVGRLGVSGLRFGDVGGLAAAGSAIGNAAAITNRVTVVSGADNAVGVQLPATVTGDAYFVYSSVSANGLKVYPQANSTINDGTANAAYVMEGRALHLFLATSNTNWAQMGLVNS